MEKEHENDWLRVSDLRECLSEDQFEKDEIYDYAVMLLEWAVSKRAISTEKMAEIVMQANVKDGISKLLGGKKMILERVAKLDTNWAEIKEAADAGNIHDLLHSGDCIHERLKTGEDIKLDVTYDENGKCFFVFHDCLKQRRPMNNRATNKGGWKASDLRKAANDEIFKTLPDELQEIIVPTKIVQVINGERIECEDKLFCLSYTQIAGRVWPEMNAREPEDTQLDIFKTERSRVKEIDGETVYWWERSPYVSNSYSFSGVGTSGSPSCGYYASGSFGVCLGFCINQ